MSDLDFACRYELSPDLAVFRRDATTVQIGTDRPRRVLIADAPPGAEQILADLRAAPCLRLAVTSLGGAADRWREIFTALADAGMIEPIEADAPPAAALSGERLTLTHRFGSADARRVIRARADAVVVVEGSGPVGDAVADTVAASGVGQVHRIPWHGPAFGERGSRVRPFPPAPQVAPTAVVLTGSMSADDGRLASLVARAVTHLPVAVGIAGASVGPMVVPGRFACTGCLERHRLDADPHWRTVLGARDHPHHPAAALAAWAAAVAAAQVLDLVDGIRRPDAAGAVLELTAGEIAPTLRSWPLHPDCRCRELAALPTGRLAPSRAIC